MLRMSAWWREGVLAVSRRERADQDRRLDDVGRLRLLRGVVGEDGDELRHEDGRRRIRRRICAGTAGLRLRCATLRIQLCWTNLAGPQVSTPLATLRMTALLDESVAGRRSSTPLRCAQDDNSVGERGVRRTSFFWFD